MLRVTHLQRAKESARIPLFRILPIRAESLFVLTLACSPLPSLQTASTLALRPNAARTGPELYPHDWDRPLESYSESVGAYVPSLETG